MPSPNRFKIILAVVAVVILALIVMGLVGYYVYGPEKIDSSADIGFGWFVFSFVMGLTMIVLPCTLPLAFVIVPLSMGKGAAKGLGIALAFGIGVAVMLSMYGIAAAVLGKVAVGTLDAPLEMVKNWVYFIAGIFAFLFALGEIGLLKVRMPSYTGAAPAFIQRQQDYLKALLLGLFLGNIGVGCPHPATPLILTRIATEGSIAYGWLLFFVHALGRILPLLLLAVLGILGVNALSWLVARKDKIERATGWAMVYVAGFILVLGLFTHDWWVNSGQHTLFEELTREEFFLGKIIHRFGLGGIPHSHVLEEGTGLFGLPLTLGNWTLALLWILPLWWYFLKKRRALALLADEEKKTEAKLMPYRFWLFFVLSIFIAQNVIYVLPYRFLTKAHGHDSGMGMDAGHMDEGGYAHEEGQYHEEEEVQEGLRVLLGPLEHEVAGESDRLEFLVHNLPQEAVPSEKLEIEHERLMHVIGIRDDLNEFFHIHPKPVSRRSNVFETNFTFRAPGVYKLWSQIKKDGVIHTYGHPQVEIRGEGATRLQNISFGRSVAVGGYQVSFDADDPLVKGRASLLSFDIHDENGNEVIVEPYLGADMHLAVVKEDLGAFIHTHPQGHAHSAMERIRDAYADAGHEDERMHNEETIDFSVMFPEAGRYKVFGQFRPRGIGLPEEDALNASFWVEVHKKNPSLISPWWGLLIISIVAILALSWMVKRYISLRDNSK